MATERRSGSTATGPSSTPDPRTTPGASAGDAAQQDTALDRRYRGFAERASKAPGGRAALKAGVFVVGLLFVLGGLALAVLPGPLTIPPVLVGVYVWSLEFAWARRLRVRVTRSAKETWENAGRHPVQASLITVAGLVAAGVAIWAVTHYDLVSRARDLVG